MRPTIDFIQEIDQRKEDHGVINPHIVVVPNRTSPSQRSFAKLAAALEDVNAIMAPPLSDLSAARSHGQQFGGYASVADTRFGVELKRLGDFIIEYVVKGELDRIYQA